MLFQRQRRARPDTRLSERLSAGPAGSPERKTSGSPEQRLTKMLSQPLTVDEVGPPRLLAQSVTVGCVLIVGLIVWAGVAEIRETALAQGQVMPAGSVNLIQHLEGGIVAEVVVGNGDIVEEGQTLIRLESAGAEAELEQLRARAASLALESARLRAFVTGRPADFSAGDRHLDLAADQAAILEIQNEARRDQRAVLLSRISQREAQAAALKIQQESLEAQIAFLEEEREIQRKLFEKGLVSRIEFLGTERGVIKTRGEIAGVIGKLAAARAAVQEARDELAELDSGLRNAALEEIGEVNSELAQVREAQARLIDRVGRLEIAAPERGIVKGLTVNTIGGVIGPGETILEIVPLDDLLVAEVRISPRDIGHLNPGQEAQVRVSSYDVTRFGSVDGRLKQLSASTFEDEEGEPYYKGVVELAQAHVGGESGRNLILPGMVVDVAINTGSKTLLHYLLRPVSRGLDGAFRER
jgi:HlyD family secretion protein/adhesin transport system membrane fusion protein